jgi:uncharacterized protein
VDYSGRICEEKMRILFLLLSLSLTFLIFTAISFAGQGGGGNPENLAKAFVEMLVKEDFSSASKNFDTNMKRALPEEKVKEIWSSLVKQLGAFKEQTHTRKEQYGEYEIVYVTCNFERATFDVKVVYNKAKQVSGLFFVPSQPPVEYKAPSYVKPESFTDKEVTVGAGEWALPGTLSLPSGDGPFPAVILVHGSGPNDRDESLGPNKPFRDLAWGLATRNIAVLRYDKRTKVHAGKLVSIKQGITVQEESIDDVLAAVSLLSKTKGIDAKRIFVLGHSLGGTLVPRIGKLNSNIAGFVVMAGSARQLEDVILEQMTYIYSLDGSLSDAEKTELEGIKQQVARVKDPNLSTAANSSALVLGVPIKYWLDLRGYNPPQLATELKQPMLIIQGERDYQVTMEDFQAWKKSLSSRQNVVFKSYPKLNHLFIEGEGKCTPEEYNKPGHVTVTVVEDIANWIKGVKS